MIKFHPLSLLTLLFSLLLSACQIDKPNSPTELSVVTVELTMPQAVTIDELPDKLPYYWKPGDLVNLHIQGGGKETILKELAPQLTSDGLKGTLRVKLPDGMPTSGLTIGAEVVRKELISAPSLLAYIAPLPTKADKRRFNLRQAGIQVPLYTQQSGLSTSNGTLSLELSTAGYFSIIEIANSSSEEVQLPKELSLTSTTPWLRKVPQPAYDYNHKSFRGEKSITELPLTTPATSLSPKGHIKLLLWLPDEHKGLPVTATIGNVASASEPFGNPLSIVFSDEGQLGLHPGLLHPTPANTSRGGDPSFTFEDIRYWIGTGSKRVALVIDWQLKDGKEALVWGYRFEGKKSTGEMLEELANTDPRFYIAIGYSGSLRDDKNFALFGIAYQHKPTREPMQILYQDKPLDQRSKGVFFIDTQGKEREAPDHLTINDLTALWKRGFFRNGYWAYFLKDTRLAPFGYATKGLWSSELIDNTWHALSWSSLNGTSMQGDAISQLFLPTPPPTDK